MKERLMAKKHLTRNQVFLLITIPVMAVFFCFNTLPLLTGLYYSFTNFKGFGSYEMVGIRNYIDLFSDSRIGNSYGFTIRFAILATIVTNGISLALAIGLNAGIRAKSFLRGLYFVPRVMGGLVVGYIFSYFFTYILPAVTGGSSMLSGTGTAWIAIVIVSSWQSIAQTTLIYIAGLQTVPQDVYESGAIDGATGWKKFCHLTMPLIVPFFTINLVLCMKDFLMVFDQIVALTQGGPAQSTESISYLIYNNGIGGGQFGYQSANAVLFFIVIVVVSVGQLTMSGRSEEQL